MARSAVPRSPRAPPRLRCVAFRGRQVTAQATDEAAPGRCVDVSARLAEPAGQSKRLDPAPLRLLPCVDHEVHLHRAWDPATSRATCGLYRVAAATEIPIPTRTLPGRGQ